MKKIPIYLQIEDDIRNEIANKTLKINDQIMTEEQLCKKYNASRMTVNKAISNLVNRGYIYRIPGKGSYVRNIQIVKTLSEGISFTDDMMALGLKPGSRLLEYCVKRASEIPYIAKKLELSGDDIIHYFVRLRTGNELPIAISYTYISGKCIPSIDIESLENSFYNYVKGLGLEIERLEMEITATIPDEHQKKLLKIRSEAVLLNEHTTTLVNGDVMEWIKTYYVGSRYSFRSIYLY